MTYAALNTSDIRHIACITLHLLLRDEPGAVRANLDALAPVAKAGYRGQLASVMDMMVEDWSFTEEDDPELSDKLSHSFAVAAMSGSASNRGANSEQRVDATADTSTSVVQVQQQMQQIHAKLLRAREISPPEVRMLKQSLQSNMALMGSLQMQQSAPSTQHDDDASSTSSPLSQPDQPVQPPPPQLHMGCLTSRALKEMGITPSKFVYLLTQTLQRIDSHTNPRKRRPPAEGRRRSAQPSDEAGAAGKRRVCPSFDQHSLSTFRMSLTACLFGLRKKLIDFRTEPPINPSTWDARESLDIVSLHPVVVCCIALYCGVWYLICCIFGAVLRLPSANVEYVVVGFKCLNMREDIIRIIFLYTVFLATLLVACIISSCIRVLLHSLSFCPRAITCVGCCATPPGICSHNRLQNACPPCSQWG